MAWKIILKKRKGVKGKFITSKQKIELAFIHKKAIIPQKYFLL